MLPYIYSFMQHHYIKSKVEDNILIVKHTHGNIVMTGPPWLGLVFYKMAHSSVVVVLYTAVMMKD